MSATENAPEAANELQPNRQMANLRHDLCTPTNAILGFAQILLEEAEQAGQEELVPDLRKIVTAASQLQRQINHFLDETRADSEVLTSTEQRAKLRHDLRTPINAITGYSELLLEEAEEAFTDNENLQQDLGKIHKAATNLLALLNHVFEPGAGGRTDVAPTSTDALVRDAMDTAHAYHDDGATESSNVLVVDDNESNRLLLLRRLEQQGHKVVLAENGRQTLELVKQDSFDLILLDIMMPEMNGYQTLEHLKADPSLRDIPVIVISALDEVESTVRCIQMGAEDYLPKPFNPVLLRARIRASLQKKRLRDLESAYLRQEMMLRQQEKLATLGTLSAGMAHELNNPAAAAQRGVGQLRTVVQELQEAQRQLSKLVLSDDQVAYLEELERRAEQYVRGSAELDPVTASDREFEIEDWLQTYGGIEDGWEVAPTLVQLGYTPGELVELAQTFEPEQLRSVIGWLRSTFAVYQLLDEVGEGATRISEIVNALKAYAYLDQAPVQDVDVHEGLNNTLVMLRSRLKEGVTVRRDYAENLPHIQAYGSELNQVWTNVISNAIEAMEGQGQLVLRSRQEGDWIVVEIEDNGPGIPAHIQPSVFDPFFTTKPPGQGTGLGLSISYNIIAHKHDGEMQIESEPGRTCFIVKLPIRAETVGNADLTT